MYDILYIFRGIMVGLMVSVPLGPMGVLIIQKTLHKGAVSGFVSGLGATCADLFYATVAAFGMGFVINIIEAHEQYLQIIGGIFLLVIGIKVFFDNPLKQIQAKKVSKKGLLGDFLSLFFLTLSNPVTVIIFMAVFAGASVFGENPTLSSELIVLLGIFIGGTAWWYTLSTVINLFRRKFRIRVLARINKITGIIIIVLGIFIVLTAFEPLRSLVHTRP